MLEVLKPTNPLITRFMINKQINLKTLITIITCCILNIAGNAQIEQVVIKGETYFVYPLQKEVKSMEQYYYSFADRKEVIKRDERNEKIVTVTERALTKEEKNQGFKFTGKYKKYQKQLIEALKDYSGFLVESDNSLYYDPTPALIQLPEGKYVQYYRDVPYIENRVVRYKNDVVAGFFEIKNSALNGPSTWFLPEGNIVREGNYLKGEKDGLWKHYKLDENNAATVYNEKASLEENLKSIKYDTTLTTVSFKMGLKEGPMQLRYNNKTLVSGNYTANKESGSWEIYNFKKRIIQEKKETLIITTDTLILTEKYTLRADSVRGKSIILQHGMVHANYLYENNDSLTLENTYPESDNYQSESYYRSTRATFNFDQFYTVYRKTNEIELEEEANYSYEGAEYDEGDEEGIYSEALMRYADYNDINREEYYKYGGQKQYTLNDFIDSAGYLMRYEGVYERYYSNGQLQYKCTIKDGQLMEYSSMYWDNGKEACAIKYIADSLVYVQEFYDYTGKKYHAIVYDTAGNVKRVQENYTTTINIDGKEYYFNSYLPTLVYTAYDTMYSGTETALEVRRELFKVNHKLALTSFFNPTDRTIHTYQFNLLGDTVSQQVVQFGENYSTVHATRVENIGDLSLKTISNGAIDSYLRDNRPDTISEQYFAISWQNNFDLVSDQVVQFENEPYTGKFNIKRQKRNFKVKSSEHNIAISLPKPANDIKMTNKQVNAYLTKKTEGSLIPYYTPNFMGAALLSHTVSNFFPNLFRVFSGAGYYPSYDINGLTATNNYFSEDYMNYDKSKSLTEIIAAEGSYLDGKPTGKWLYKNRKGLVLFELNYNEGQRNGVFNQYEYAYPENKLTEEYYMENMYESVDAYTTGFPKKTTRYLALTKSFKNGLDEGAEVNFNWKGDTTAYTFYKEGMKEGKSYERNTFFYTVANYEFDQLDGMVRTYLTRPKRDSILLYDLNFQNGLLQGESKAYHTNGRIAKKGFFLTGQPIDDYQAFDTLGYMYQYVKFQYGQPIEEKIWEENELSVKYEFDWRDSIAFNFTDITSATSVENLLYQLGYDDEAMYQPYLGRPSLTDKSGINYHVTKYYPNDTIARTGTIAKGKKIGCWMYFNYKGVKLAEADYFDTLIVINDSIQFKAKGILSYVDLNNEVLSKSWIIEKIEKYDCSHTDHMEERMLYCFWEKDSSQHRLNGYVKNYYDNGSLQNEGWVKNGLPTGIWKMYDVNGNLSQVGEYVMGKRNGRWLKGDLGSVKNMSEICLNPNLENLEEILSYQEKLLDISVVIYDMGKVLKQAFYGINMNSGEAPEGYGEDYYEGY